MPPLSRMIPYQELYTLPEGTFFIAGDLGDDGQSLVFTPYMKGAGKFNIVNVGQFVKSGFKSLVDNEDNHTGLDVLPLDEMSFFVVSYPETRLKDSFIKFYSTMYRIVQQIREFNFIGKGSLRLKYGDTTISPVT